MSEPRRWVLRHGLGSPAIEGSHFSTYEKVHVIETSAYDAVVKERDELKARLEGSRELTYDEHVEIENQLAKSRVKRD